MRYDLPVLKLDFGPEEVGMIQGVGCGSGDGVKDCRWLCLRGGGFSGGLRGEIRVLVDVCDEEPSSWVEEGSECSRCGGDGGEVMVCQ